MIGIATTRSIELMSSFIKLSENKGLISILIVAFQLPDA